jgi:hypothetical protein
MDYKNEEKDSDSATQFANLRMPEWTAINWLHG